MDASPSPLRGLLSDDQAALDLGHCWGPHRAQGAWIHGRGRVGVYKSGSGLNLALRWLAVWLSAF